MQFSKQSLSSRALTLGLVTISLASLSACGGKIKSEAKYPTGMERTSNDGNDIYSETPSIFGKDGLVFGNSKKDTKDDSPIGVNSYLWRASLDTVSFMPLASADPFGGVILTDWYSPPGTTDERFKMNIFILDKQLSAEGVQVKIFRQKRTGADWRDVTVTDDTSRQTEDAILTRARQLRVGSMGGLR
jgi:hypothetical protein